MMFHSSHIHMPNRHRQRSALRTFFPSSSFSPPDAKEPLRRGILFSSVATVLLLVGAILTWLGFNDVFGGKISMTGPLLIALALLMLLLSLRQFMLARKRNRNTNRPIQMEAMGTSGVTAVVVDHDDGNGAATIVVEAWDSDEPNQENPRNNYDLAPPSYTDIAQSCSSNCPSFISHEDHNEAPPTYEETCGGELYHYNSETSLTVCGGGGSGSRRSSSQFEGLPSPCRTSQPGQGYFQNDPAFNQNEPGPQHRPSNTLCPRTNIVLSQAPGRSQGPLTTIDVSHSVTQPATDSTHFVYFGQGAAIHDLESGTHKRHSLTPVLSGISGSDGNSESDAGSTKPPDWSRRSFSSIPSYTCLLSESGEVSAEVFDTSSIIEGLMPGLAAEGKEKNPASQDLLMGPSSIPTRSHSMSSVNTSRQGVPYNITPPLYLSPCSPPSSGLPNQPMYDQQPFFAAPSPISTSCNNSSQISKSPSFPYQNPRLRQGSDSNLVDYFGIHSAGKDGSVPLHPQAARSYSTTPERERVSVSPELGRPVESLFPHGAVTFKIGGDTSIMTTSQESTSSQGKLFNTQDIQETI